MAKKVLKFGGTSVGTIERILHVAKIIKRETDAGDKVIAVVSAMSGKTNELLKQSKSISNNFSKRELDVLLSSGEQITSALLAGALIELGVQAKSWLNWQVPILTEGENLNARIINMNTSKIDEFLSKKGVAIIPGFQGISKMGDVTTMIGENFVNISSVEMVEKLNGRINFKFNLIIHDLKNFTKLISELKQKDYKFKIIRHKNKKYAFFKKLFSSFKKN